MKNKIEGVFNALQELELKPTPQNVSIMDSVYDILRGVYKELEETEAKNECSELKETQ